MPHIKIECSSNINDKPDTKKLLEKLHNLLPAVGPFNKSDIKSRIIYHNDFLIADGAANLAFIHCEIRIMSGRTIEIRKTLTESVAKLLQEEFKASLSSLKGSVSVEVCEIEKESYAKHILE